MQPQTLETFFSSKILRIPAYQRDYAWELHHVDDLWSDLREAIGLGSPHYIGTFILAETPTPGLYDLVDGQQRLTTLTMLLRALIDRLPVTAERLRISSEDRYLQDSAGRDRLMLLGDNHSFFRDVMTRKLPVPATRSQKRLVRAFARIDELVVGVARDDGTTVKQWIEQIARLSVMQFVEANEGNAIRIFQTVNDRGRPLATIEKLKSYLIYASSKYLAGALDATLNERFGRIFRAYDSIKDIGGQRLAIPLIGQSRFDEDAVLRYHFLAYPESFHNWGITADAIFKDALKPAISKYAAAGPTPAERIALRALVDDYSGDLACFFESLASLIRRAEHEPQLYKMFTSLELSAALYPLTVRLHMRKLLDQSIGGGRSTTFLDAIEATDLRVYKTRGTSPEKDVAQLASQARRLDPADIAERLALFVRRFMDDDLFRRRLRENVYEQNEGARFILQEWEEHARREATGCGATIEDLKALRELEPTIDHVLAQEETFAYDGRGFEGEDHYAEQVHRLGNLTLVEKRINSAARNKTPEEKASDDKLYKASAYSSARRLGIEIDLALATGKPFGAAQVQARTEAIVDFCVSRWPIPFAGDEGAGTAHAIGGTRASRGSTFEDLFGRIKVQGPTEDNSVTNLAWRLGKEIGLKLRVTYQLPDTADGAHRVVFVLKGSASMDQRTALLALLAKRAGGTEVDLGSHPTMDIDVGQEEGLEALIARFRRKTSTPSADSNG